MILTLTWRVTYCSVLELTHLSRFGITHSWENLIKFLSGILRTSMELCSRTTGSGQSVQKAFWYGTSTNQDRNSSHLQFSASKRKPLSSTMRARWMNQASTQSSTNNKDNITYKTKNNYKTCSQSNRDQKRSCSVQWWKRTAKVNLPVNLPPKRFRWTFLPRLLVSGRTRNAKVRLCLAWCLRSSTSKMVCLWGISTNKVWLKTSTSTLKRFNRSGKTLRNTNSSILQASRRESTTTPYGTSCTVGTHMSMTTSSSSSH